MPFFGTAAGQRYVEEKVSEVFRSCAAHVQCSDVLSVSSTKYVLGNGDDHVVFEATHAGLVS